jgi:hypothetical protein
VYTRDQFPEPPSDVPDHLRDYKSSGIGVPSDLPGGTDNEIIALLEASRIEGQWHASVRDAIASMIGRGWSDLQIRLASAAYCKDGAGDPDLGPLIDGARKKWNKPEERPDAMARSGGASSVADWFTRDLHKPDLICGNWLTTTSRTILYAPTGLGKTMWAMGLAAALGAGRPFLHWKTPRLVRVLVCRRRVQRQTEAGQTFPKGGQHLPRTYL